MSSSSTVTLKVTGLKNDNDEKSLRTAFSAHGYVTAVEIVEEEGERSATVTYTTRSALEAAGQAIAHFSTADDSGFAVKLMDLPPKADQSPSAPPDSQPLRPPLNNQPPPHSQPPPMQPQMHPPPPSQQQPPPPPQQQMQPPYGMYGGYGGAPGYGNGMMGYDPGAMYWQQQQQQHGGYYGGMGGMPMMPPGMPPPHGGGGNLHGSRGADQPLTGDEVKLFVGGLPVESGEIDLRTLMQPYGNIVDIHVMKPSNATGQRCAFVTFEHHVSALAATKLGGVHKMTPHDKPIVVRFADSQGKRQRSW